MTEAIINWKGSLAVLTRYFMTRGDQRERDRAKNLKKQQQEKKGTSLPEGMTVAQKKEMDAEIMRQKQLKALEAKQNQGGK